jgi:hypothetical protein
MSLSSLSQIPITPTLLLTLSLFIVVCYALYLDRKIVALTRGKDGASLEDIIRTCITNAEAIEKQNSMITKHTELLEGKISHSLRNAQTIRYKAFDANGSNQSFSVALVNEKGNGLVLSSLHSHDRMSTFAKPLENYESTYELTEEELAVIDDARAAHGNSN